MNIDKLQSLVSDVLGEDTNKGVGGHQPKRTEIVIPKPKNMQPSSMRPKPEPIEIRVSGDFNPYLDLGEGFTGGIMMQDDTDKRKDELDNNYKYHTATSAHKAKYNTIRSEARALAQIIEDLCPDGREKSLAHTKLEEAMMWANASIARND